ncbi:cbb3-type cytochrome c oxidase subunit 3 [Loktanella sp. D2R18]|uniref:cbb3-type cytochrome c oxidase subunit 3 n=1 Tax=Rhodobacterales TaxID=204455 RepID=UPI000DEB6069|nr:MULTISPECIES: cbb3-type cytochrome c oxidase subunit 3 [Rhodobacterales]MDO6590052.1 cbb3-type cytochrome c oxidase subunit 3 [Yoonia sp. 1_MG-2023]RBW45818.1 cbb3-type cytochrome c oxidase subunit 3 [Loktanella sp. D2R18]
MDTYSILREIADSWVLLAMTLFFLGVIVWAFRPGSKSVHADTANIPFRNEVAPGSVETPTSKNTSIKELQS